LRGWFTLLIFNIISCYWVGGWQSDDIFLKLGGIGTLLIHPLIMLIPILLTYLVKRTTNNGLTLLLFPLLWVGFEYFDNIWQFCFPWIELGNSETYNLNRIQYAELVGVHGITFLICSISSGIYFLTNKIFSQKWKLYSFKPIAILILILIAITFPNEYSYFYLKNASLSEKYNEAKDSSKIIKTAVIQPNIDPLKKWVSDKDKTVEKYITTLNNELSTNADLFILNETSVPYYFLQEYNANNTNKFFDFVNKNNKYLLMGVPHVQFYPDSGTAPTDSRISPGSRSRYKTFNSAILLEPGVEKNKSQIHEKSKLVPFSENIPYKRYLPFLGKLIRWSVGIGDWDFGPGVYVFNLNNPRLKVNTKFETWICFESVFSDFAREGVKNGAEFIVIVTNDGWFGNSAGPVQHKQYAVLRAIENRKWIVRCAQTGISCYIDPLGHIYDEIPINNEGVIFRSIIANNEKTFYTEHGDIIGTVSYYVSIFSFIFFTAIYFLRRRNLKSAV
jgi:apolipoprotein N-acyltransferase